MRHDGVAAIDHGGIVAALIEHAHVQRQHGGIEDIALYRALVGADDHHMGFVNVQVLFLAQQRLEHLVVGHHVFKADQRHGVYHAGIMRVEGDDIADAHVDQLLQAHGTIQAFAAGAAMLTAFVQHGHHHGDTLGLAADRADDALEILEMIIRGHGHFLPIHVVMHVMRANIHKDIQIHAAHAFAQHRLALARAKARAVGLYQKSIAVQSGAGIVFFVLKLLQAVPFEQPLVDFFSDFLTARHGDNAKRADRHAGRILLPRC